MPPYGLPPYGGGAPAYGTPPSGYGTPYAGLWLRVGATLLDGLIVGIPAVILLAIGDALGVAVRVLVYLIVLAGSLTYTTLLIATPRGQTVGMRAVSTKAVKADNGELLSVGTSLGRAAICVAFGLVGSFTVGILPLLDYLWPLWDKRNQTLHDKVVGSVVIRVQ
jgi:uncharacterized RDD family membrane protein YckC